MPLTRLISSFTNYSFNIINQKLAYEQIKKIELKPKIEWVMLMEMKHQASVVMCKNKVWSKIHLHQISAFYDVLFLKYFISKLDLRNRVTS